MSECNHIYGHGFSPWDDRWDLITDELDMSKYEIVHIFKYCPTCGVLIHEPN